MSSTQIITQINNRKDMRNIINSNHDLIIIKFGASWCGPCKIIHNDVYNFYQSLPSYITCIDLDIDTSSDVYSWFKHMQMVSTIPTILVYNAYSDSGNNYPDFSVVGTDTDKLYNYVLNYIKERNRRR